ncbi:MAG: HisA/HisF-related TIM barrel protein [Planctomycetota bacterium]
MTENAVSSVIPVMDLMIGQIVLAQSGDREAYRPVHSKLIADSSPVQVARALFSQTGCKCLYLADLDSFEGASPNWEVYRNLLQPGFDLWVDANWLSNEKHLATLQAEFLPSRVRPIISTETLADVSQLSVIADLVSDEWDPIFSLDMRNGELLGNSSVVSGLSPQQAVSEAVEQGARSVIVLDVATVGTDLGTKGFDEINGLVSTFERIEFISGGGVRSSDDVEHLLAAGCQHVLVASAIHDCRLTPYCVSELDEFRSNQPVRGRF